MPSKQGMRMSGETTETLHLTNLERQHIGEYSCSSTNEVGENHSLVVILKVQCECIMMLFSMSVDLEHTILNQLFTHCLFDDT